VAAAAAAVAAAPLTAADGTAVDYHVLLLSERLLLQLPHADPPAAAAVPVQKLPACLHTLAHEQTHKDTFSACDYLPTCEEPHADCVDCKQGLATQRRPH
jgi:hypothetical protein